MKIKGRIIQIIKPKEIEKMISSIPCAPIKDFKYTHHIVVIVKESYPSNYFSKLYYCIKNRKIEFMWPVVMKECKYKLGDIIQINVKPYYKKTMLYLEVK